MSKISAELSAVSLRTRFHDPGSSGEDKVMARTSRNFYLYISVFLFLLSAVVSYRISAAEGEVSPRAGRIVEIEINGSINPSTVDYIKTALLEARAQDARALLILMDTPGGLLSSTKDIVKMLLNSEVPVIVYVYPRGATATSAGVFITLSAHVAAMSPGTSIGAAHPVMLGRGQKGPGKPEEKKMTSLLT